MEAAAPTLRSDLTRHARYGVTALLTLGLVMWIIAMPESGAARLYYGVIDLFAAALVLSSTVAVHGWKRPRAVTWMVTILCASAVLAPLVAAPHVTILTSSLAVLVVTIYVPWVIVGGLRSRRSVDIQMVLAAVAIYLLLGLMSAVLLSVVGLVRDDPVLNVAATAQGAATSTDGSFRDRTYFAFVTLSTVGYGDVSPASGAARAIAMFTALVGQLYLVVAVATVVTMVAASYTGREQSP